MASLLKMSSRRLRFKSARSFRRKHRILQGRLPDVADRVDFIEVGREASSTPEEPWDPMHPPVIGRILVDHGVDAETAGDIIFPLDGERDERPTTAD